MRLTTVRELNGGSRPFLLAHSLTPSLPHCLRARLLAAAWLLAFLLVASPAIAIEANALFGGEKKSQETSPLGLDDKPVDPFGVTNATATVLIFVGAECPISNRYAPELRRLHEKFAARGVRFWIVYPDPDITVAEIRKHTKEYNLPADAVRDPHQVLVRKSKATVTPEAAVFTSAKRLAYHGRIDDRVADFGKERPAPTQRDLNDAIESVLAGRKPRAASAAAVGCRIPDRP